MIPYTDRRSSDSLEPKIYDHETQRGSTSSYDGEWRLDRRRRGLWVLSAALCFLGVAYCGVMFVLPEFPVEALEANDALPWDAPMGDASTPPQAIVLGIDDAQHTMAIPEDPTQVLIPPTLHPAAPLLRPIRTRPNADVLESYYGSGTIPANADASPLPPVDFVFLWVNASGEHFQEAMATRAEAEEIPMQAGSGKRFRDNGELRGAMRSVKSSVHGLGNIHVLSADFDTDSNVGSVSDSHDRREAPAGTAKRRDGEGSWRLGQIPEWLDWDIVKSGIAGVKWHFHSKFFRIPVDHYDSPEDKGLDREYELEWRFMSVPSFNSFAIESRIGWVDGLNENFVLANDDMFLLADTTPTDFHHPLLGDVLRIDGGLLVKPELTPDLYSTSGEWGGLQHASQMISRRFPSKKRGYMHHVPKSLSVSLAHETSVMWEDELTEAASRGFRRSTRGIADVEMSWLAGYLRVERWREAFLWTWAVARLGGEDGLWGDAEKHEIRGLLGINDDFSQNIMVERGPRTTLDTLGYVNGQMGWDGPKGTRYTWSSMDGLLSDRPGREHRENTCIFSVRECLPADFYTDVPLDAADMFTHIAFAEPQCGDCLVKALVTASGERGLSAVLPHHDQAIVPERRNRTRWERSEPILPLTDTWEAGNFSVYSLVRSGQDRWAGTKPSTDGSVNLRQWSIKLLSRYAYVLGSSRTRFNQIHNLRELNSATEDYDRNRDVVMACVNDDQPDNGPSGISEKFSEWMWKRWGDVDATWERPGFRWYHEQ